MYYAISQVSKTPKSEYQVSYRPYSLITIQLIAIKRVTPDIWKLTHSK